MNEGLSYEYQVVPHPRHPRKWAACWSAPGHGTRYVRDEQGSKRVFADYDSAKSAAIDAAFLGLNGKLRDPVTGNVRKLNSKARSLGGKLAQLVFSGR
jgi:hypothetical protein